MTTTANQRNSMFKTSAVAVLALGSALGLSACAPASHPSASNAQPDAQVTQATDPPTTAAPVTTTTISLAGQVVAWYQAANGNSILSALTADFTTIQTDVTNNDPTSLGVDCVTLTKDAQSLAATLPTPDSQLTDDLTSATNDFENGGQACTTDVLNSDYSALASAAQSMSDGNAAISAGTARLNAISNGS